MYAWCQDMPGVSAEDYAELMANLTQAIGKKK
jgi:predicted RNase H-like HicB family nuclease